MFVLSRLEADVRVPPAALGRPPLAAVSGVLEELYIDRVVPGLGLVVSLYDVLSVGGGRVHPNDGAAYYTTEFRLVVFRPFVGEVLCGRIASADRTGLRVALGGMFADVRVPDFLLQEGSVFDAAEGAWKWLYDGAELYMDVGEPVRLRVTAVKFHPRPPPVHAQAAAAAAKANGGGGGGGGGEAAGSGGGAGGGGAAAAPIGTAERPYAPMEVTGEMCGVGLGNTAWWPVDGEEEEAAAVAAEGEVVEVMDVTG